MHIREARASDVVQFSKYFCPRNFVGTAAEKDGEVIGLGWVVFDDNGAGWVCFEALPELLEQKVRIARASIRLVKAAQSVCHELFALEDEESLGGSRWLQWLGFEATNETRNGLRVMKWRQQLQP